MHLHLGLGDPPLTYEVMARGDIPYTLQAFLWEVTSQDADLVAATARIRRGAGITETQLQRECGLRKRIRDAASDVIAALRAERRREEDSDG